VAAVALAGWAGLLVTGLNLMPAGQLDGGHVLYALFGRRLARYASMFVAGVLVALGFMWNGWWLWAVLVALFGQQPAPVLNEITPLDARGRALAILGIVAFVLVFTPIPLVLVP
jgi:membrane-associated protease RseP (regulator of RpoE activity)